MGKSFPFLVAVTPIDNSTVCRGECRWDYMSPTEGPTSKAPQRQQWIEEMRVRIPPPTRSLRTASRHFSSPRHTDSRRMPEGLHRFVIARSRVRIPPGPTCGPVAQLDRAGSTFQTLVVVNPFNVGECRRDYMGERPPLRREVGGSSPPPGAIRSSSAEMSRHTSSPTP